MVTSSQNVEAETRSPAHGRELLCLAWAIGLFVTILLNASLLADVTAFVRFAAACDRLGAAWAGAAFGYVGIVAIALNHHGRGAKNADVTATTTWSILSICGYTVHLFLLRWPWLSGAALPDARLTAWSATLSTTWNGIPWLAFAELLSLGVLVVHGCVGLISATPWRCYANLSVRARIAWVAGASSVYALAAAVVIALATGRR